MKFTCTLSEMEGSAARCAKVADAKSTIPMTSSVLIEAKENGVVSVTSTNIDTTMTMEVPAKVDAPGSTLLPGVLLARMLGAAMGDDVRIEVAESTAKVTSGRSRWSIGTLLAADFPDAPRSAKPAATVPCGHFAAAARIALVASSERFGNSVLVQVEGGTLRIVSTDGHRLSLCEIPCEHHADVKALIDDSAIEAAVALAAGGHRIRLDSGDRHLHFSCGAGRIAALKKATSFPKWEAVMPEYGDAGFVAPRGDLIAAFASVLVMTDKEHVMTVVSADEDQATLVHAGPTGGEGKASLPVSSLGSLQFKVNGRYVVEFLKACSSDEVRLHYLSEDQPICLQGADEADSGLTHIVMTMKEGP